VKDLKDYSIEIQKLGNKKHEYEFNSGDAFFKNFEQSLIEEGSFKVLLTLDKSETMLTLHFHITGHVQLICDRTLEPFDHPINIKQKLILKLGDQDEVLTDEIEIIKKDTQQINVAQYIYEYIGLAIPMKKLHPKLAKDRYEENEHGILVYSSGASSEDTTPDTPDSEDSVDPRWQILKNLRNN
jgi:uncharacterized metal-binding protein YceD (DUF177 family)